MSGPERMGGIHFQYCQYRVFLLCREHWIKNQALFCILHSKMELIFLESYRYFYSGCSRCVLQVEPRCCIPIDFHPHLKRIQTFPDFCFLFFVFLEFSIHNFKKFKLFRTSVLFVFLEFSIHTLKESKLFKTSVFFFLFFQNFPSAP